MLFAGCHTGNRGDNTMHFSRFEKLLFGTPVADLQHQLVEHSQEFDSELFNINPYDQGYMEQLGGFVTDTVMRSIYAITDSLYGDLGWLEKQMDGALDKMAKMCPEIRYDKFFTLITGDYQGYDYRVFCTDNALAVSIDHYALGAMERYQYFGVPAYIVGLCTRDHIASDCMAAIARQHIVLPEGDLTLLDYAIAEGKTLYFLEQVLPQTPDTIRLRYTKAQLDWMESNVGNVWAWLIQNKMIYSTDLVSFHNLIDDAPKTNAFGDGSAPRTTSYIGWQIVRCYMKKSGTSMSSLLEETDSRKILTESGWRP